MGSQLSIYGNGCYLHLDCFTCPEGDCIGDSIPKSQLRKGLRLGRNRQVNIPLHISFKILNPKCKYCGSEATSKYGFYKRVQRYICKICKRKFKADNNKFHMKVKSEYFDKAINEYDKGRSIRDIRYILKQIIIITPPKQLFTDGLKKSYLPKGTDTGVIVTCLVLQVCLILSVQGRTNVKPDGVFLNCISPYNHISQDVD